MTDHFTLARGTGPARPRTPGRETRALFDATQAVAITLEHEKDQSATWRRVAPKVYEIREVPEATVRLDGRRALAGYCNGEVLGGAVNCLRAPGTYVLHASGNGYGAISAIDADRIDSRPVVATYTIPDPAAESATEYEMRMPGDTGWQQAAPFHAMRELLGNLADGVYVTVGEDGVSYRWKVATVYGWEVDGTILYATVNGKRMYSRGLVAAFFDGPRRFYLRAMLSNPRDIRIFHSETQGVNRNLATVLVNPPGPSEFTIAP